MLKADDTRYADADLIALTNNGMLYLFSSLKLTLAGQTVEHVNYPGLASYSTPYYNGCGPTQGWFPDINTNAADNNTGFYTRQGYLMRNPNPKGSFQCSIPMRHIFRFVDDYTKLTYALFSSAAAGAGKVVMSKLAWSVPIFQPNDVRRVNLFKSIAANNVIPVSFRMRQSEKFSLPQARSTVWRLGVSSAPEKPRRVFVGLQTNKSGNQENNAALFNHCNLTNIQVCLNHSRCPSVDMATDFAKEQYAGTYKSFSILLADTMGWIIYWLVVQ